MTDSTLPVQEQECGAWLASDHLTRGQTVTCARGAGHPRPVERLADSVHADQTHKVFWVDGATGAGHQSPTTLAPAPAQHTRGAGATENSLTLGGITEAGEREDDLFALAKQVEQERGWHLVTDLEGLASMVWNLASINNLTDRLARARHVSASLRTLARAQQKQEVPEEPFSWHGPSLTSVATNGPDPSWTRDGVDGWYVDDMDVELDLTSRIGGPEVRLADRSWGLDQVSALRDVLDTVIRRAEGTAEGASDPYGLDPYSTGDGSYPEPNPENGSEPNA